MKLARRGFLGALAAAPLGAHAAAEHAKAQMYSGVGSAIGAGTSGLAEPSASHAAVKFTNFEDWLTKFGMASIKRNARHRTGLDPDIIEFRLPLATKVRMQQERNLAREIEERREWFNERFSLNGIVEWWP